MTGPLPIEDMKWLQRQCLDRIDALAEAEGDPLRWEKHFVSEALSVSIRWQEHVYAATVAGALAGFVTGTVRNRATLRYLYTMPLHRGNGIGRALVDHFCALAWASGATVVRTAASTVGAYRTFRRAGFTFVELRPRGGLGACRPFDGPTPEPLSDSTITEWLHGHL